MAMPMLVPLQQSELIAEKLKKAGVETNLVVKKGAGHGWLGLDKDLPSLPTGSQIFESQPDAGSSQASFPAQLALLERPHFPVEQIGTLLSITFCRAETCPTW